MVRSWEGHLCEREGACVTSPSAEEHHLGFSGHRAGKFSCSAVCTSIHFRFIWAQIFLEITSLKTIAKHSENHRILPRKCRLLWGGIPLANWQAPLPAGLGVCCVACFKLNQAPNQVVPFSKAEFRQPSLAEAGGDLSEGALACSQSDP